MAVLGKLRKTLVAQIADWEGEQLKLTQELADVQAREARILQRLQNLSSDLAEAGTELDSVKARIAAARGAE